MSDINTTKEPERPMRMDEAGPYGSGTVRLEQGAHVASGTAPKLNLSNIIDQLDEMQSQLHSHLIHLQRVTDRLGGPIPTNDTTKKPPEPQLNNLLEAAVEAIGNIRRLINACHDETGRLESLL